jgi:protein gp37
MAQNSKIEWTHHTFNPWWGCVKVSPACKNCYAQAWSNRLGLDLWGGKANRRFFSDHHWKEPLKWNRDAEASGERRRVFCASMADVFERRAELNQWREKLWPLIEQTPFLDWLLLTKRPENVAIYAPWKEVWPDNVWLGTTAETQKWADKRIPVLLKYPAAVKFVSCEPLFGEINLSNWLQPISKKRTGLNWVIAGGESGAKARPMSPLWAEVLRDQCLEKDVPFHFKQWGHWGPEADPERRTQKTIEMPDSEGKKIVLFRVGKHTAGRELSGETWDGFPNIHQ